MRPDSVSIQSGSDAPPVDSGTDATLTEISVWEPPEGQSVAQYVNCDSVPFERIRHLLVDRPIRWATR